MQTEESEISNNDTENPIEIKESEPQKQHYYLGVNEYSLIDDASPYVSTGSLVDCILVIIRDEQNRTAIATHLLGEHPSYWKTPEPKEVMEKLVGILGSPPSEYISVRFAATDKLHQPNLTEMVDYFQSKGIGSKNISQPVTSERFADTGITYDMIEDRFSTMGEERKKLEQYSYEAIFSKRNEREDKQHYSLIPATVIVK